MSTKACVSQYFPNKIQNGLLWDTIELKGNLVDGFTFEVPWPFIIAAFGQSADVPSGLAPTYTDAFLSPLSTADNDTFSNTFIELFIAFMEANKEGIDSYGVVTYQGEFLYYFYNYLNDWLKPRQYNQFLWPESWIVDFWANEAAAPVPATRSERFRKLISDIFSQSDRRMWGAPGLYTLAGASAGNIPFDFNIDQSDPDFTIEQSTLQSGGVDIAINRITGVYAWIQQLDNTIVWGSQTVPYGGVPDWASNPGDNSQAVIDYLTALLTDITGDAPIPYAIPFNIPDPGYAFNRVSATNFDLAFNTAYDFGALALPIDQKLFFIYQFQGVPNTPYYNSIADFIVAHPGDPVKFCIPEYKPVE